MRLIGHTQAGSHPSATLAEVPGPLPKFAGLPLSSQPTSNSLLQSQPSSLIPQNTATLQSQPQENISAVSPADYQRFSQMFVKTTGSESALLDGNAARDIFLKAKLPTAVLGQIWSLVDLGNRGSLDLAAFVMAMHLIHGLLSGSVKQLPPFLPEYVWQSVNQSNASNNARQTSYSSIASLQSTVRHTPSVQQPLVAPVAEQPRQTSEDSSSSASPEWVVLDAQKQQMDAIFDSLDKSKSGNLSPDQVASYLMTSRLDQQDLASIWDLADIQNTGIFNKLEFAIALFLVNRRRAGLSLPNVVPESLISSLRNNSAQVKAPEQTSARGQFDLPQRQQSAQIPPAVSRDAKPVSKSSIDELADIFSSPSPDISNVPAPAQSAPRAASTRSDLTYSSDLPKVRSQLTSSFKPTSTFGQSLLAQQTKPAESPSLIGEDVTPLVRSPTSDQAPVTEPTQTAPAQEAKSVAPAGVQRQSTVDYEALRSVPPPPPKNRTSELFQSAPQTAQSPQQPFATARVDSPSNVSRGVNYHQQPGQPANHDLLADSEISGQLSEATSDIANISNQVKSLTSQTSNLHEKKVRADQELSRILAVKENIENKLKGLRTSYANEVKQVEQVEATLATAKEETEALRSEASISEAKLNNVSGELNEKQIAVEELQKTNSALREKLGLLNAEIAEVEKQLEAKTTENSQLEKEVNVRKSQVQVAFVKVDDLKNKIAEIAGSHERHQKDIQNFELQAQKHHEELQRLEQEAQRAEQERVASETRAKELEKKNQSLQKDISSHSTSKSLGIGAAVSAVAGAAIGGAAGLAGSSLFGSSHPEQSVDTTGNDSSARQESSAKEVKPSVPESERSITATGSEQNNQSSFGNLPVSALVDEVKEAPTEDLTGIDDFNKVENQPEESLQKHSFTASDVGGLTDEVTGTSAKDFGDSKEINTSQFEKPSVAALVDEVKDTPTEDLTGVDDFEQTEHKQEVGAYENEDLDDTKQRFPDVDEVTNRTESTSAVTDSYRQSEGVETPVTSPDNSEYRFQAGTAGVVGGMVGMPGVLVGVQRTDSMTSSVQNNASLSVRDDNIDEISERETLEDLSTTLADTSRGEAQEDRLEDSDRERISPGLELFEIVNADEARGLEGTNSLGEPSHPLAQSYIQSDLVEGDSAREEEFPPIKELDYDESSSSEDDAPEERFDDAVDHISSPQNNLAISQSVPNDNFDDDFNDDFDDLEPAQQEKSVPADDFFNDEFDDLKIASADTADDFPLHNQDVSIDDHFTGADEFASESVPHNSAPDFSSLGNGGAGDANDEWEQLFAGFGNANNAPLAAPQAVLSEADSSKDFAVEELVGMGFDKAVVIEALKRENWNIEAATNYLLDNA